TLFPEVTALAVFGNELIVAGDFTEAGGVRASDIARWNGSRWADLGNTTSVMINAMVEYDGKLLVGGYFDSIGGTLAKNLASWTGTNWEQTAGGVNNIDDSARVNALALRASSVFVGGEFTTADTTPVNNVARWDGTRWFDLGGGVTRSSGNARVESLVLFNDEIYALGSFDDAGGQAVDDVARWNSNSWFDMGVHSSVAYDLVVHNNELYMAGEASGSADGLARWDGAAWQEVPGAPHYIDIEGLVSYNGDLIVLGEFREAGGKGVTNIARFGGVNWFAMGGGTNDWVADFASYQAQPVAMGFFKVLDGAESDYIARWDSAAWQPFAPGLLNTPACGLEFQGFFVVGGPGQLASVADTDGIAAWNGTSWLAIDGGLGAWPNHPQVVALAEYNSNLYAAGATLALGANLHNIVRLVAGNWFPVGGGVNGPVWALVEWNGLLVVGGDFTDAGGTAVTNIAAWNGANWSALGSGLGGPFSAVKSLTVHEGLLVAGGDFTRSGAPAMFGVAAWNGSHWTNLGGAMPNYISKVYSHNGALYVAGDLVDPIFPNPYLARTVGGVWQDLDGGTDSYVHAFGALGDDVLLGGEFVIAGGDVSGYLARWHCEPGVVGDTDGDGDVDIQDLANLLAHFGICAPDPNFDPAVDFDGDNCVTLQDLALLLANFGT
ncbi:MAG: hypothetical protein HZB38_02050, partial [Planctomycetes bacterium]|nr:hypothetical protein [Planctomycetota bacterium]